MRRLVAGLFALAAVLAAPHPSPAQQAGKSEHHAQPLPVREGVAVSVVAPKELVRALSRAADVDVALKNSSPVLETLSVYVGELVAGS